MHEIIAFGLFLSALVVGYFVNETYKEKKVQAAYEAVHRMFPAWSPSTQAILTHQVVAATKFRVSPEEVLERVLKDSQVPPKARGILLQNLHALGFARESQLEVTAMICEELYARTPQYGGWSGMSSRRRLVAPVIETVKEARRKLESMPDIKRLVEDPNILLEAIQVVPASNFSQLSFPRAWKLCLTVRAARERRSARHIFASHVH